MSNRQYLVGVDIGTSGTKTVLFDTNGNTVASAIYEYPMYQPERGWAEQDPVDWFKATANGLKSILDQSGIAPDDIKGIGLSGQMHGLVLLDENNNVLTRSIIWCDQRTEKECEYITETMGAKLIEITANPALTGFTLSKLLWVKNNLPDVYAKVRHILLPKDYVRYMMTRVFATEVSDASGMQLMNISKREWSKELLDTFGIPIEYLPKLYESYEISGYTTETFEKLTGIKAGTPVVGGAGDQAAAAIGNGIVKEGMVSDTLGTSGVVFASTDNPLIDKCGRVHTFCHAVPGKWHIMGVTQGAGLSLRWFRDNFCNDEQHVANIKGIDVYKVMDDEAALVPAGANGVVYLPYLMGERTPHLDPNCKAIFYGISAKNTKDDMLRAVLEGVVYSQRDCLGIIRELGVVPTSVRAGGGGAKSKLWRQMLADNFGVDIALVNSTEGGALGVAILAGVGVGIYPSVEHACETIIKESKRVAPDVTVKDIYDDTYATYQALYTKNFR